MISVRDQRFRRIPWLLPLFFGLLALPASSRAEPPPDASPAWSPWFNSLRDPHTGMSCCSEADCRRTTARIRDGHYEAFIDNRWVAIPPEKVLDHETNPTGEAVVCWSPVAGILCFVRGPEG
jgi:hypothetical protein